MMIEDERHDRFAILRLNDPAKRNALSIAMFDALDEALAKIATEHAISAVLLTGNGPSFCAGFDLAAAVDDPQLIGAYIHRLSGLNRALRRLPQVVIAAVQGAAIAGGCALLSACDFVLVSPDVKLGYPVHQLGISPAVTIPTLLQAIGPAEARSLLMSGEVIDGTRAKQIGLATHMASSCESLVDDATSLARAFASKPANALQTTKRWLSELDGSLDDSMFDGPAASSALHAGGGEAQSMLAAVWAAKPSGRG